MLLEEKVVHFCSAIWCTFTLPLTPALNTPQKTDINIEKAADQFIELCVLYENMIWDDPNDSKTLRQIEAVAGKYMNNEEFKQRIESSKNEIAIERFQNEVEEQKQNISQSMSRGI